MFKEKINELNYKIKNLTNENESLESLKKYVQSLEIEVSNCSIELNNTYQNAIDAFDEKSIKESLDKINEYSIDMDKSSSNLTAYLNLIQDQIVKNNQNINIFEKNKAALEILP